MGNVRRDNEKRRQEALERAREYVRCFETKAGAFVLEDLKRQTINRRLGNTIDQTAITLRAGANELVLAIMETIEAAKSHDK